MTKDKLQHRWAGHATCLKAQWCICSYVSLCSGFIFKASCECLQDYRIAAWATSKIDAFLRYNTFLRRKFVRVVVKIFEGHRTCLSCGKKRRKEQCGLVVRSGIDSTLWNKKEMRVSSRKEANLARNIEVSPVNISKAVAFSTPPSPTSRKDNFHCLCRVWNWCNCLERTLFKAVLSQQDSLQYNMCTYNSVQLQLLHLVSESLTIPEYTTKAKENSLSDNKMKKTLHHREHR